MKEKRRLLIEEWYRVCKNYRKTWLQSEVEKYLKTFRITKNSRRIDQTRMYANLVRNFGYVDVAEEMIRQNKQRR